MAVYSMRAEQLRALAAHCTPMYGYILLMTKIDEQRPFGREIPSWHVVMRMHYAEERPGWTAIEVDKTGEVVNRWTGGLD